MAAKFVRALAASVATALALFVLARASVAPLPLHGADSARLRLSWSARPERIETCRTLSAEELAKREEHMRQRVECDGRSATYTLRVESDGRLLGESIVRGGGLRHDRPIHLLTDFDLPPGAHRILLSFIRREKTDNDAAAFAPAAPTATDTGLFAGRAQREAAEHARRASAAIPSRLVLDTLLTFAPRRVAIVTFDQDRQVLSLLDERSRP